MTPATKTRRIEIRVSEEERALGEAAASVRGETLSEFVRRAARSEARRVLEERTRFVVDDQTATRFLAALDDDERHEAGLRRLVQKPSVIASE